MLNYLLFLKLFFHRCRWRSICGLVFRNKSGGKGQTWFGLPKVIVQISSGDKSLALIIVGCQWIQNGLYSTTIRYNTIRNRHFYQKCTYCIVIHTIYCIEYLVTSRVRYGTLIASTKHISWYLKVTVTVCGMQSEFVHCTLSIITSFMRFFEFYCWRFKKYDIL